MLVDFTEYRLPDMDRNGVDMQVLSLTSPGIRAQPARTSRWLTPRIANGFLADAQNQPPDRHQRRSRHPRPQRSVDGRHLLLVGAGPGLGMAVSPMRPGRLTVASARLV
jgi:hypothetical protein